MSSKFWTICWKFHIVLKNRNYYILPFVCYLYFVYCWLYSDCYIDKASHCWWLRENVYFKTFEPLGLNTKLDRHWLFLNKIPRNQRHKLFYLLCKVMLFVFHIYVINFRWGRPQRSEINLEIYFTFAYLNKNRKIYWSEQSFTDHGPEDRYSPWGQDNRTRGSMFPMIWELINFNLQNVLNTKTVSIDIL